MKRQIDTQDLIHILRGKSSVRMLCRDDGRGQNTTGDGEMPGRHPSAPIARDDRLTRCIVF